MLMFYKTHIRKMLMDQESDPGIKELINFFDTYELLIEKLVDLDSEHRLGFYTEEEYWEEHNKLEMRYFNILKDIALHIQNDIPYSYDKLLPCQLVLYRFKAEMDRVNNISLTGVKSLDKLFTVPVNTAMIRDSFRPLLDLTYLEWDELLTE